MGTSNKISQPNQTLFKVQFLLTLTNLLPGQRSQSPLISGSFHFSTCSLLKPDLRLYFLSILSIHLLTQAKIMKRQNLLPKLVFGLTIGVSLFWLNNLIKAQEFYPFSASFFNPTAFLLQSEDNPALFEMLAMNDHFEIITFLLSNDSTATVLQQDQVTFLAPTDRAFQELPAELRTQLLQPDNLTKLLKYHTIAQTIQAQDLELGQVDTLLGDSISITRLSVGEGFKFKLNEAEVSEPLPARNGVLVPINRVLIPPGF